MKRTVSALAPRIGNVRDNSDVAERPAIKEKRTRLDTRYNQTCKLAKREQAKHQNTCKNLKVCKAAQSSHRARVRRSIVRHAVDVGAQKAQMMNEIRAKALCHWARKPKYTSKLPNLGIKFWNAIILPSSAMSFLCDIFCYSSRFL